MRKKIGAWLLGMLVLFGIGGTAAFAETERGEFMSVPADWERYEGSVDTVTAEADADGFLTIEQTGAAPENKYYGALYRIQPQKAYSDVTVEVTFRHISSVDAMRWFGIVYRTRETGSALTGYVMNYRYGGASTAASAIDATPAFAADIAVSSAANAGIVPVDDGALHTMKVRVTGNIATHYMDGAAVQEVDLAAFDAHLGVRAPMASGGVGIIVNRSAVKIKSVKVTGTEAPVVKIDGPDQTIVQTYRDEKIAMVNAPTAVREVTSKAALDEIVSSARKPSNAILHFDERQNVVASDGTVIGGFADVYKALDHKVIPVVFLEDAAAADALLSYFETHGDIADLAVMSADPAVVKKIKDEKPVLRGVVDYAEKDCYDGDKLDLYSLVARTNRNRGLVVTIPQSVATAENVSYLHARFMTVWVRARSTGKADLYDSVFSGAYGVVSDDSEAVYDFLESFDEKTYARMPFLVAHRGLPYTHNENSVSGVRAAIEAGATHLELDGYATKAAADGSRDIVLMHDDDLARTSTGTGNVFDYTREELNAFRLDQYSDEPIPSLSDVLQIIKGTGVVLVFEIKANGDAAIVTLLKENLDKYEMYDQVVVISFDLAKLAEMQRVLPQVPTANLNMLGGRNGTDPSKAYMLSMLRNMGEYNTHIDPPKDCTDAEFDRYWLRDRGIVGWYWTFDNELQVLDGWNAGFVGLTNNRTYEFRRDRRKVSFAPAPSAAAIEEGDPVALVSEQYNGACADVTGVVAYREAVKGGWRVAAKFVANRTMYTQTVFVRDENAAPPPDDPAPDPAPEKRGCGGDIGGTCAVAASLCALLALSLVVQRKRATHR